LRGRRKAALFFAQVFLVRRKCGAQAFCEGKTLAQGGIHFRRASEIIYGVPSGPVRWGELGDSAVYLGRKAFFNLK